MKFLQMFKKGDIIIFVVILLIAVLCWIPFINAQTDQLVCEISKDNTIIKRIALKQGFSQTIAVKGDLGKSVIQIQDNSVWFKSSDCPDKVCVHTGKLTHAGQIAVCLPNHIIVKLIGNQTEVDAIVG